MNKKDHEKTACIFFSLLLTLNGIAQQKQFPGIVPGDVMAVREDAETLPSYLHGHKDWLSFLEKNLNTQVPTENKAPKGEYQVKLHFVVDNHGNARNIVALSRYGYGMEEEAIRVLKQSQWKPGTLKGRNVNASKIISIIFFVAHESILI